MLGQPACPNVSDQLDIHIQVERLIGWNVVLRVHRAHPGIVAADAHLRGEHAQEHVLRSGQFVLMLGFFQHECAVRLQAERER